VEYELTTRTSNWQDCTADHPEAAPLDQAAKHAIAAREAISADGSASLRLLIDMVLMEIGRVIARRIGTNRPSDFN
jgi:hypothetical protein